MTTKLHDLFAMLESEDRADAYAGDAEEMIKSGDEDADEWGPAGGPREVLSIVTSELYDVGDLITDPDDELDVLEAHYDSAVRGAILLLHAAHVAKQRCNALREKASRAQTPKTTICDHDPTQPGLFEEQDSPEAP